MSGRFTLLNGIVWGNKPAQDQVYRDNAAQTISFSDIEGGYPGEGNLDLDPLLGDFANFESPIRLVGLIQGSPVIDQGDASNCPATDQSGFSRPEDGDGNGSAICDMGAFEYRTDE